MRDYCLHQQWSRVRDSVTNISKHSWSGSVSNSRQEGLRTLNRNPGNLESLNMEPDKLWKMRAGCFCSFSYNSPVMHICAYTHKQISNGSSRSILFSSLIWSYSSSMAPGMKEVSVGNLPVHWSKLKISQLSHGLAWKQIPQITKCDNLEAPAISIGTTYTFIYGLSSQWASQPHKAASMTHFLVMSNRLLTEETCNENSQYCFQNKRMDLDCCLSKLHIKCYSP